MNGFSSDRLLHARLRRGLTQRQLAEMVGMVPRSISGYERGVQDPSEQTIQKLAAALRFPASYFAQPDAVTLDADAVSFRSLSSMTARRKHAVLAAGGIAVELIDWIEARFDLPRPDFPTDLATEGARTAAAALRAHWQLGQRPVSNVVHLMESKGIRVFSLTEDCVEVDAFSLWRDDRPFVFLNMQKSGERGRFDAAHELGHLVLHRHGGPSDSVGGSPRTSRQAEDEANAFASAFLMPEPALRASAPRTPSLAALMPIKRHWKVSLAAVLRRFYDLGCFTQWHYDRLNIEIAKRGGRKSELGGALPRESSQLLRKVFLALAEDGVGRARVAADLHVSQGDLDALIFGLVLDPVRGGRQTTPKRAPSLRLVK